MNAYHITGERAAALDAKYNTIRSQAQVLHRTMDSNGFWEDLPVKARGRLMTMVSVADAIGAQDSDGYLYETARKVAKRDSAGLREWTEKVVVPVIQYNDSRRSGDTSKRLDSFSPTNAGVPSWYNAQRLTQELLVPQVPVEREGVGVFSEFDPGARTLSQVVREFTGRAGRIARETGRPGGAARASYREAAISTDVFWYGLEAVGTDFTRMESAYAGTDQDRMLSMAIEQGYQNTLDDIFYQGVGTGLKPFGIATHPGMQAAVGDDVSSATTAQSWVELIADGIERLREDSNGVAVCKRVKIGGNIWRLMSKATQSDTMTGVLAALRERYPGVEFEASYRLKNLETGVDGILYLADSPEGLTSIESSPLLFSWSEGPLHVNMVAGKVGGAYPRMPIYSRLDRHAVS